MSGPTRGRADYLDLGDWNAVCSMCGFKRKASQLVKNWQGMYRCPEHNEMRHPQDFVRAVPDIQTAPWVQPQSTNYIYTCDPTGRSAIPGYAIPGCVIPSFIAPGNLIPFYYNG